MRKRLVGSTELDHAPDDSQWLDLENLATVEVTSEDPARPIDSALLGAPYMAGQGWRAAQPGEQTIRLIFDTPQDIKRIRLSMMETDRERTQEFWLRWSPDAGQSFQEIVRQQWNFSPNGSTREVEDYTVNIRGATVLELVINPDKSGGAAFASLSRLQVA